MRIEQGTIFAKEKETKKEYAFPYEKAIAETWEEVQSWCESFFDDVKEAKRTALQAALDTVNYAIDLKIRADVRQRELAKVAGPDKSLGRAYKDLLATFLSVGMSEADAQALAAQQVAQVKALIAK